MFGELAMTQVITVNNLKKTYPLYKKKGDKIREALSLTGKRYHREFEALLPELIQRHVNRKNHKQSLFKSSALFHLRKLLTTQSLIICIKTLE